MSYEIFADGWLVRDVPERLVRDLYDAGQVLSVDRGSVVLKEGESPHLFFVVLTGEMEAFLPATDTRPEAVRLENLGQGAWFGEYGFIDRQPASASVRAVADSTLFRVDHAEFQTFLNNHRDAGFPIYRNLLHAMVDRLRRSNAELDIFGFVG
ncbi:MAG: cyclic nucleotide-binding domain-containing protein [Pseudomonadota bacterium]